MPILINLCESKFIRIAASPDWLSAPSSFPSPHRHACVHLTVRAECERTVECGRRHPSPTPPPHHPDHFSESSSDHSSPPPPPGTSTPTHTREQTPRRTTRGPDDDHQLVADVSGLSSLILSMAGRGGRAAREALTAGAVGEESTHPTNDSGMTTAGHAPLTPPLLPHR